MNIRKLGQLFIALMALLALHACSGSDEVESTSNIYLYGNTFDIGSGVIWQGNPYKISSTMPCTWIDTYTNSQGTAVSDEVEGFTASDEVIEAGNFTISLYERGLTYNPELASAKGKGAAVSIQLSSADKNAVATGKYTYGVENKPGTFIAYCSSEYQSQKTIKSAPITEGEVNVEKVGDNYHVTLTGKTSFDGDVSVTYEGPLETCSIPQPTALEYTDVSLSALFKQTWLEMVLYGSVHVGRSISFDTGDDDMGTGKAFLSLTSGTTQYADSKSKDLVDIALYYDEEGKCLRFESPLKMRQYLGHNDKYNFPCHTIYMKAPASFTDEDYENLNAQEIPYEIQEETVTVPADEEAFEQCYVFFKTGRGTTGVMRIKQFTPSYENTLVMSDVVSYLYPQNPALLIDVKCPSVSSNPQIR